MSLIIAGGTNPITINYVEFDAGGNEFLCYEDKESDPVFSYELPFNIEELPTDAFTEKIYLFKNGLVNNRKLLKLKLKEKPEQNKLVGYIFPLIALIDSPQIFDNIHLKKIAFNVLEKLLKEKDLSLKANSPSYRTDTAYNLSDFYDEDLIVIVVCDQFVTFPNYSFIEYLPSLYKLGFRIAPYYNFNPPSTDCNVIINNYNQLLAGVTVGKPQNDLHLNYFINSLIKNDLFLKENEVARFHLYYQVIEMLLEKVFKNEVKNEVITKFNTLPAFDVKELFRETMRETYSLDKLVGGHYSNITSDILDELRDHINDFFAYIGVVHAVAEISSKIYKVRNTLFHGYSKILGNDRLDKNTINSHFKKVNDSFEYLIIDLIMSYKDHLIPIIATPPAV